MSKHSKLYDRAGLWQTRALQALAKGDYDRAGRLRTKSLQLAAHAKREEEKRIKKEHRPQREIIRNKKIQNYVKKEISYN